MKEKDNQLISAVEFIIEFRKNNPPPMTGAEIYGLYTSQTKMYNTVGKQHFINLLILHGFHQVLKGVYDKETKAKTTAYLYEYEEGSGVY